MEQYKTCYTCKQTKPTTEFNKRASRKDGFDSNCKLCAAEKKRAWNAKNPDKVREMNKRSYQKDPEAYKAKATLWIKNNWDKAYKYRRNYLAVNPGLANSYASRRRSKLKSNQVFEIRTKFLAKLYKSLCIYCGANGPIEADHVIPVARGGRHSEGNLVPACQDCNRSKHQKLVTEWRLKR